MRIRILICVLVSINFLSGCSSVSGNVVPKTGPTMEQIYDGMNTAHSQMDCKDCENVTSKQMDYGSENTSNQAHTLFAEKVNGDFYKLPNPELHMYVFPHFATRDEIPVPGYFTVFNAYERDHYALTNDTNETNEQTKITKITRI